MNPQYMTVTEAAKHLGVTSRTVQRYLRRGLFPGAYQLPGGVSQPWIIPADEVLNFVKPDPKKK
jgi:excisionase family DNA binding protein